MPVRYKHMNAVNTLPIYLTCTVNCSAIYVSLFKVVSFIRASQRKACNSPLLHHASDKHSPSHLP